MAKMKFNVLHLNYNKNEVEPYDILPYFRDCWKAKYYKEEVTKIKEAKTQNKRKKLLKDFIESRSLYMFWARCEWEFLVAHWPFGSKQMYEDLKVFWKDYPNIDDYNNYAQDGNGVNNINTGTQGDIVNESTVENND